jgi:hypothetical protein
MFSIPPNAPTLYQICHVPLPRTKAVQRLAGDQHTVFRQKQRALGLYGAVLTVFYCERVERVHTLHQRYDEAALTRGNEQALYARTYPCCGLILLRSHLLLLSRCICFDCPSSSPSKCDPMYGDPMMPVSPDHGPGLARQWHRQYTITDEPQSMY